MKPARIMALGEGGPVPLFDGEPAGIRSPSSTLLIETHDAHGTAPVSRLIPEQVAILFHEAGLIEHSVDGGTVARIPVSAGAVVLSLRDRRETIRWMQPSRVTCVRLDDRVLDDAARAIGDRDRAAVLATSGAHDPQLTMLMQALHLEQANAFRTGMLYLEGIEQALAATLMSRHVAGSHAVQPALSRGGELGAVRARRVAAFVRENLARPVSLAELANCAGYSPSHFSALFRRTFGMTPHRYVQQRRIERAIVQLAKPHWSVLDVAMDCGFQTQQHFARVFRAVVGVSPMEYRRGR